MEGKFGNLQLKAFYVVTVSHASAATLKTGVPITGCYLRRSEPGPT